MDYSERLLRKAEQLQSEILTVATAELRQVGTDAVASGSYPRVDYLELQQTLNVDILNYNAYQDSRLGGFYRQLETALRSDVYLALLSALQKSQYQVVFAMSERVGIPFAVLNRMLPQRRHLVAMFQSWSHRQEMAIRRLHLSTAMDTILVHCQSMKQVFIDLGAPPERIHVAPYGIDHRFFVPQSDIAVQPGFVLSVGEVRSRNYELLFESVKGLPAEFMVLASGMWYAREKSRHVSASLPDTIQVRRGVPPEQLRTLYAQAQFVVLPVRNVKFSAGATASLEAMAMGRAVIATRSPGIRDFIRDGETGLLVEPDNPYELREAIAYLLANPQRARQMGENGRQFVEQHLNLDIYVARLREILLAALQQED